MNEFEYTVELKKNLLGNKYKQTAKLYWLGELWVISKSKGSYTEAINRHKPLIQSWISQLGAVKK